MAMAAISPQEALREQARRELARRDATKSLEAFCGRMDDQFVAYRHTKAVIDVLEALEAREIDRAMIFMAPRHGKSYLCSERYPAYHLGRNPRSKVMIVAYGASLAEGFSRKARDLVASPQWPFTETRVSSDHSGVASWSTTRGGEVFAAGFGGSLSGKGSSLLVVDDPIKNPEEANSQLHRDKTWDFYGGAVRTRLERNASQLVMLTRWHEDDLAGRILSSGEAKRWHVLTLPALAIENDALGRAPGEKLWPEGPELPRPSDGVISTRQFAALYQQSPTPAEGDLFKRAWFDRRYSSLPTMKRAAIYIDGAWKEGVQHDRSAIALWGTDGKDYYVIDVWSGRVEYPDLKQKVKDYYSRWRNAAPTMHVCVEDAASGTGLVQELKRDTSIPIVGVTVDKSKYTRAESVTPTFESGKVFLPQDASWLDEWIEEHVGFPGSKHDDMVDTTSGAIAKLMTARSLYVASAW
jgi:predicted phage terminase large subunit-like protein